MQFLAPTTLIALLPLGGIIVLLYLLKLRRREVVIPSVLLWQRAVQDVQANAPFQKLRRNLLLLLQLMALAAIVGGLAAPFIMAQRLGGKSTVLVLDASASMGATDAAGSRFEQAKQRARQIVKGMGRRDEVALVVCAARAWVAQPFSRDRHLLLSTLNGAQPTDCPTNMRDGLLLALSLAAKRPQARVYVISDGAFPSLPEVAPSAEVRFIQVGERSDNVALLAFEVARPPGAREHQLFLRMKNYARAPKRCVVSIYHEEDLLDAQQIELRAEESRVETYNVLLKSPGLLRAELEVDDDLTADNVAYSFGQAATPIAVLLVTPGNFFLEQALLVLPEVELYKTTSLSAEEAADAYQKYDVAVFDRIAIPQAPRTGALLLIAAESWGEPASMGDELATPTITRWEAQHPVLRYVNLGAMQIARARALQPAARAKVLAWAGQEPIIVAQDEPELRTLVFGWDFLDSDLPLRVGFPVLLSNAIRWLTEARESAMQMTVRPGTTLRLRAPPEATEAQVTLPDGQRRTVSVVDGQIVFTDAARVGVYHLTAGNRQWRWAVDLRNTEESDLTPSQELKLGARKVQAAVGPPKVERHLWPYLIILALAVLLGEWHLYHRRY